MFTQLTILEVVVLLLAVGQIKADSPPFFPVQCKGLSQDLCTKIRSPKTYFDGCVQIYCDSKSVYLKKTSFCPKKENEKDYYQNFLCDRYRAEFLEKLNKPSKRPASMGVKCAIETKKMSFRKACIGMIESPTFTDGCDRYRCLDGKLIIDKPKNSCPSEGPSDKEYCKRTEEELFDIFSDALNSRFKCKFSTYLKSDCKNARNTLERFSDGCNLYYCANSQLKLSTKQSNDCPIESPDNTDYCRRASMRKNKVMRASQIKMPAIMNVKCSEISDSSKRQFCRDMVDTDKLSDGCDVYQCDNSKVRIYKTGNCQRESPNDKEYCEKIRNYGMKVLVDAYQSRVVCKFSTSLESDCQRRGYTDQLFTDGCNSYQCVDSELKQVTELECSKEDSSNPIETKYCRVRLMRKNAVMKAPKKRAPRKVKCEGFSEINKRKYCTILKDIEFSDGCNVYQCVQGEAKIYKMGDKCLIESNNDKFRYCWKFRAEIMVMIELKMKKLYAKELLSKVKPMVECKFAKSLASDCLIFKNLFKPFSDGCNVYECVNSKLKKLSSETCPTQVDWNDSHTQHCDLALKMRRNAIPNDKTVET